MDIMRIVGVFFYFYEIKVVSQGRWVSVSSILGWALLSHIPQITKIRSTSLLGLWEMTNAQMFSLRRMGHIGFPYSGRENPSPSHTFF